MKGSANQAVFLSYASQDAEAARRLCEALRAAGVEVWFDQHELRGGDAWDQKIRRQIKECALFLPVISAGTNARLEGYFRREWKLAVDRTHDMAEEKAFLVPVVIDATTDAGASVPEKFREVQWMRLPGGEPTADFCARVKTLLGGADVEPERSRPGQRDGPVAAPASRPVGRRVAVAASLALAAGLALGAGAWFTRYRQREAVVRRLHAVTLPEIDRRIAAHDVAGAFALAVEAEHEAPDDPLLQQRWPAISVQASIETEPAGAEVHVKAFQQPQSAWRPLGRTPVCAVRLPKVYTRWRIERPGWAPLEVAAAVGPVMKFALAPADAIPAGMVRVPGGTTGQNSTGFPGVTLADFLLDRHEVTNRQFKEFVDAGGYTQAEFWQQPFLRSGRTLTRDEALAGFRDSTGRPGPTTWKNGTFADGAAELPVTGVSWFEAAAYAAWAGKRLPSIHHWRSAARVTDVESIVPLSNFAGKGLAAVGTYQGVSACGAYDMAGNAKEWCWNAAGPDSRYALGGAWREPEYMFVQADALSPFERSEFTGFRCLKPMGTEPVPPKIDAPHVPQVRDYAGEQPVGDEIFRVFRSLYSYDKGPLEARVEASDDTDPRWRRERVSYRAAYGDERIAAVLFLPKNSAPPYQTIVYFPGAGAISAPSSENLRDLNTIGVLVGSGRALLHPVYQGTYERRRPGLSAGLTGQASAAYRDWLVTLSKDLGRSIDYLETRPDLQVGKLAYAGNSWGGAMGAILPALEPRIKTCLLIIGGFLPGRELPEADQINFAPRNTAPTLMLSGRYDFRFPLETSQRPMFRWLGAPPEQKRHVLFDTGHALKPEQIASVAYAWLDQHLGLVK